MSSALTGLNQIPGVIGSAVFDAHDQCVVHMMPPPYDTDLLGKVMVELRNALNVLNYLDDSNTWSAIVLRFEAGYVVVRNVNAMTVMVIAQPTLNPAMLSVGFNVASLKLEKEGLPPPALPPPPLPPPPPGPAPRPAVASHGHAGQSHPSHAGHTSHPGHAGGGHASVTAQIAAASSSLPLVAPPQVSSSQNLSGSASQSYGGTFPGAQPVSQSSPRLASSSQSIGQSGPSNSQGGLDPMAVPDAVGKPVMDALLKALARHIGPFARLMMKEELHKLGATSTTLGMSQYEDFIGMLGRRLQDPNKRREFMTEAENLAKR